MRSITAGSSILAMIFTFPPQRLKRVFGIDIEQCERCGGKVRIIAGQGVLELN
jgi:hypothetical protein